MSSPSTFTILDQFLERGLHEVEGRGSEPIPPPVLEQIKQFAAGELDETSRQKLTGELNARPEWLAALAEEVKARRAAKKKGEAL